MTELIVHIGDSPNPLGFKDGDVMHAHNDTYLLWQHTQRITDHRKEGGGFFKPIDCMACKRLEAVSEYKFQQISRTEIKRITLSNMSEEILTGPEFDVVIGGKDLYVTFPELILHRSYGRKPQKITALLSAADTLGPVQFNQDTGVLLVNGLPKAWTTHLVNFQTIYVKEYIARRKASGKKPMFGTESSIVWFGGRTDAGLVKLSTLWTDVITPETGFQEADHKQQKYNSPFLRRHLVVVTTDFDNVRRGTIEEPDVDETDPDNPITLAIRKHHIDWRNMDGMSAKTIDDILNPRTKVEVKRDVVRVETDVVEVKTR